ncbi:MAG TPA: antibiotic biosynthesis monooxygenase family protein [Pseudonocardiaceae bacterium]|jgi:heme-degrading monooxygenase HmoA|nr:antibiotic biosynthesis monooxygenase family protein [Pseudonocardiaceae bacterium]
MEILANRNGGHNVVVVEHFRWGQIKGELAVVTEIALIDVVPGQEYAFAVAYRQAHRLLVTSPGCLGARMTRGVESPSRFVGIVRWQSVDDHLNNFRKTERFTQYQELLGRYVAGPPVVEHFTDLGVQSF